MSANEIHKGDIGTVLRVTLQDAGTAVDISGATTKQLILYKPSGTAVTKTASFTTTGVDGKLQYTTTAASDLNEVGTWRIQAYVVLGSGSWKSDVGSFVVYENLA